VYLVLIFETEKLKKMRSLDRTGAATEQSLAGTNAPKQEEQLTHYDAPQEQVPCTCDSQTSDWDGPPEDDSPPKCFFFDVGVNVGSSSLAFVGDDAESSCMLCSLARPLGDDHKVSGPWEYTKDCIHQTAVSIDLLKEETFPALLREGFDPKDCRVVMIEGSKEFDLVMDKLETVIKDSLVFKNTAAWMCDGRLQFNQRTTIEGRNFKNKFEVTAVNFLRLLYTLTREKDFVVVKMDIEGGEYEILPCLVDNKEIISLLDIFYIEAHDRFMVAKPEIIAKKDDAFDLLRQSGVKVSTRWP